MILCSINLNPGYRLVDNAAWPDIAAAFEHTYEVVDALRPDIWLAPHAFMFAMEQKAARIGTGANPFVDPQGYRDYVSARASEFRSELARQEASSQTSD